MTDEAVIEPALSSSHRFTWIALRVVYDTRNISPTQLVYGDEPTGSFAYPLLHNTLAVKGRFCKHATVKISLRRSW